MQIQAEESCRFLFKRNWRNFSGTTNKKVPGRVWVMHASPWKYTNTQIQKYTNANRQIHIANEWKLSRRCLVAAWVRVMHASQWGTRQGTASVVFVFLFQLLFLWLYLVCIYSVFYCIFGTNHCNCVIGTGSTPSNCWRLIPIQFPHMYCKLRCYTQWSWTSVYDNITYLVMNQPDLQMYSIYIVYSMHIVYMYMYFEHIL